MPRPLSLPSYLASPTNFSFPMAVHDSNLSNTSIATRSSTTTTPLLPKCRSLIFEVSGSCFLNASYQLPNGGGAMYKVRTKTEGLSPKLTSVKRLRLAASTISTSGSRFCSRPKAIIAPSSQPQKEKAGSSRIIAHIHHQKSSRPSVLEIEGDSIQANALFSKGGLWDKNSWSHHGRDRQWKLPDGRDVKWRLLAQCSELVTNDKAKTRLAIFRPRSSENLPDQPKRHGSLEIFPAALIVVQSDDNEQQQPTTTATTTTTPTSTVTLQSNDDFRKGRLTEAQRTIVEWILVTLLYIEKIRWDRESAGGPVG